MQIHSLDIFPKPEDLTIRIGDGHTSPTIKVGDGNTGITIYLMEAWDWNWDSEALYQLAEQLVTAGRDLAAKAGQAQQVEDQEAV